MAKKEPAMKKTLYDYCIEKEAFQILDQWDNEKNEDMTPHDVFFGSHKKVWWRCEKGHRWYTGICYRTTQGKGCPVCSSNTIIVGENDLASSFPSIAAQWHPTKNEGLNSSDIAPLSNRKVWWQCDKGHEWQARVYSRTMGSGCPFCTNRRVLLGENDLATTHPRLKEEWHPTKNEKLRPEQFVAGTRQKVWWQCDKGHEWQASINARAARKSGCPICANKTILTGENDLATMFPKLASQWHPTKNEGLTPHNVSPYSNKKVWWQCDKGHEWETSPGARAKSNSGCPYCTGRKVLAGFNDLATVYPKIAAQWHPTLNETLTPEMVTSSSNKKVWWECTDGHVWKAVIYSRTGAKKSGCPVCSGRVKKARDMEMEY